MITVSIIGSGNVAQHLISAFNKAAEIDLVEVYARNKKSLAPLLEAHQIVTFIEDLKTVDVCIIAVSDDAIAAVSNALPFQNTLVAHTSGSIAMTELSNKNRKAVFYPLQTFSKNKAVDFSGIPICIESENLEDLALIEKVARSISATVLPIDSKQRKALHVAAVFVNNFVNHLYGIGNEICDANELPFDILKPLIVETAAKIQSLTPLEAQTGPAKRKDQNTIQSHLEALQDDNQKAIYRLLTKSIQSHE
jgi:predicted short-subunit dehydrogenase-like oxidoreductase (DUF2520 family)